MKNIVINNISTSYYITECGKCYNNNTGKYLKGQQNYKNQYISYNLTMPDGSKTRQYAHRLVAEAFIPNPNNLPVVNHKDGDKLNNCVENLEWATHQENSIHAIENELRELTHIYCFNKDQELVAEYRTIAEASRAVGIAVSIIAQETRKDIKTLSGGFYWSKTKELGSVKNYKNLGKAKKVYQYDLNGKFITSYPSVGIAAKSLGLKSHSHISECCRGKIKTYKGFIWRYEEDVVSALDES